MSIEVVIVRLNGLVFLLYGLAFAVCPQVLSRLVADTAPGTVSGLVDMRASYGGMSVAVGALLLVLASGRDTLRQGLAGVVLLMLCMASGRLLGMAVDGTGNLVMSAYLALEVFMAMIALWLLVREPR